MNNLLGLSAEPITDRVHTSLQGVGMIRSEYLCRAREEYVTVESCRQFIYDYVCNICKLFYPNPVWYRTSEFVVPEANVLAGTEEKLPEKHYILGLRGIRRGLKYKDSLRSELQLVSDIAKKFDNLHILFSYIKDPQELDECKKILTQAGFQNKFGIMVEIPSVIVLLDEFIERGVSNLTIGLNDLTMMVLGTYRGSEYHQLTHPSVEKLIFYINNKAKENNIPLNVGDYLNNEVYNMCKKIGVDNAIINYDLLPDLLHDKPENYPYLSHVSDIKKLTKSRIRAMEESEWRRKLNVT